MFDYEGTSKTELTVSAGDVVVILSTDNDEWWEGELRGKIGFFPKTYCELISPGAGAGVEEKKPLAKSGEKTTSSSDKGNLFY